jgi:glucokinase
MACGPCRGTAVGGGFPAVTVLACDLGGTHARLLLAEPADGSWHPVREQVFDSPVYPDLSPIIQQFLEQVPTHQRPRAACMAVAGPVTGDTNRQSAQVTNLPWHLDNQRLSRESAIPEVRLINDFEAIGYRLRTLDTDDTVTLQAGATRAGAPKAVIGAGTGLGQAIILGDGDHDRVLATEGGHVDFGPTDELQIELLHYLRGSRPRVSYEDVLSGPGLERLFRFLVDRGGEPIPSAMSAAMADHDPAAVISEYGLNHREPLADRALDLFVAIYGAQAGNLALACLAHGGVYLAGGIAPKLLDRLRDGPFLQHFHDKGKMAGLMGEFSVRVITNTAVGLHGAVEVAMRL